MSLSLGRDVPGRLDVPSLKEVHHHGDAVRLEVLWMMSVDSGYGTRRRSGNMSQRFEREDCIYILIRSTEGDLDGHRDGGGEGYGTLGSSFAGVPA